VREFAFGSRIEPKWLRRPPPRCGTGGPAMLVNTLGISDDAKSYEVVHQLRWPGGVGCPHCGSAHVDRQGRDDTEPQRQRYRRRWGWVSSLPSLTTSREPQWGQETP
jgi:hypothetical protein